MRHTKIIATIGPATGSERAIRELVAAGVDVFRLNFSHGTHETHQAVIERIRAAARDAPRPVAILQDLSGPKIRTGTLAGGEPIRLEPGDELTIAVGDFAGGPGRVSTTFAALPKAVQAGDMLLLDDGRIQLCVQGGSSTELKTQVVDGGLLGEHKGINAPGVELPSVGLTEKDAGDLAFGVAAGVDVIALSFVQTPADLRHARRALVAAGAPDLPLVAKLERPEAVARIDEILRESDAVMVARGDLGLELPLERVPRVQKEVTVRARALGIPVIVATQVFESMRTEPRPTRAEVSDAANAVHDRVDAIMLAGETAVGAFPVRTVQTLDLVIRDAESMPPEPAIAVDGARLLPNRSAPSGGTQAAASQLPGHGPAMCEAAVMLAEHAQASAIVAVTRGGKTARVLSALRPRVPIHAATDQETVARRLMLSWGVMPVLTELTGDVNAAASRIGRELVDRGAIPRGSAIVLVSVTPDLAPEPSNFLKLQRV
jgi:pyruvate kinase